MESQINPKGILLLALIAALVATLCDAIHVYTKTLSYPDPFIFNQAIWVFPGFFLAFLFMAISYVIIIKRLKHKIPVNKSQTSGNANDFAENIIMFAFVYMLSGFANFSPEFLILLFYSTFLFRWAFSYEKAWLMILAILLALGGIFFEGALAAYGLVAYRDPNIFYVPYWLGGVYMHGAFALREGMRWLGYR